MSRVCLLFCPLSELEEEIWICVAAGEPTVCGKVVALRGRCRVDLSLPRLGTAAQPGPRGSPADKNYSSGIFHLSVKGNGISL